MQRAGVRYCEDCGVSLGSWCADCGSETTPGKGFCGQCGASTGNQHVPPMEASPTQVLPSMPASTRAPVDREERRLVTVLFCDLVGFTPLTERLDAEQVRSIQMAYFDRMSAEIARYGGTVEKFAGDAVLALFGVPVAHGDDAERAVHCAIALQEAMTGLASDMARRWHADLAIRVGVNTGEAVSGTVEAAGRQDLSVTGDVINTAARLQTAAEPGGIVVGQETMRLARRTIRFGDRREISLKGKAQPVFAYGVLGARGQLMEREPAPRMAPLVGREHELGTLSNIWARARDGEGSLVALVGDAGIGKSRLISEAVDRFVADGCRRQVWGRCLSHGQDISLWLVTDLLRSLLGVRDEDDEADVAARLDIVAAELLSGQEGDARAAALDVLGNVLGLPTTSERFADSDPQARRQVLVRTLRLLLAGLSQQAPSVLILEDVHWMDAASAEVLTQVLQAVPGMRLLVLAAYRPGWSPVWAEWGWALRMALTPLANVDTTALACELLHGASLSPDLERYVAERAGGNPYFVEELLLALEEAGGIVREGSRLSLVASAADRLPSTLTEIILARLDRLDPGVRSLIQIASVIGRVFAIDLLSRVAEWRERDLSSVLVDLGRSEIVFPQPDVATEYAFKHVTMRDVAYSTLLHSRRTQIHRAIARSLAALHPVDEAVEVVAYHFAQTDEHTDAAFWLERAGDRSATMYANTTAIGHYEEAKRRLEAAGGVAADRARLSEKLGGIFRIVAWYDEALEELEAAALIFEESGDIEARARVVAQIGDIHFLRGAPNAAITAIRAVLDGLDEDEEDEPSGGVAKLYVALVDPLYHLNRFEDALMAAYRAVELARLHDDEWLSVEAAVRYGLALGGIGRLHDATTTLEEVIPRAETIGNLAGLLEALMALGDIALALGGPNEAKSLYNRAFAVAESRGDLAGTAATLWRLGGAALVLGDWTETRVLYERAAEMVRSMSFCHFSAPVLMALGEHYLRLGEEELAARYLEEPLIIAQRSGQTWQLPYLQVPLADRELALGHAAEALSRLTPLLRNPLYETALDHRAMQIAAEAYVLLGEIETAETIVERGLSGSIGQGNRLAQIGWLELAAELAARGRGAKAVEALLEEALELARSMSYSYGEARVLLRRGLLLGEQRDLEGALVRLDALGARSHSDRLRAALEGRSAVGADPASSTVS